MTDHSRWQLTPLPIFSDNYLWLIDSDRGTLAVDPGEADTLLCHLQQQSRSLQHVLITHGHYDHIDGLPELQRQFPNLQVHGPADLAAQHGWHAVHDGDTLSPLPGLDFTVLAVPGHTRNHLAYHSRQEKWLFCGDTLFAAGCGRIFDGSAEALYHSLQRLAGLPDDTLICCAHEYTLANLRFAVAVEADNPALLQRQQQCIQQRQQNRPTLPSLLAEEKASNPFLRCHLPSIQRSLMQHYGKSFSEPETCFKALRTWKDGF